MLLTRLFLLNLLFVSTATISQKMPERLFPEHVSTKKNDLNYQLTNNEELAIFTRANADYSSGKVYLVSLKEGSLRHLEKIGFSDNRYKDSDPWLSPTGEVLYFISDRPAFIGDVRSDHSDYDIWRSRKSGQHWLAPEHLATLNSTSGEFGPEINNGYIYFSSKKTGQYNIYRALITADGFAEPEILPAPFNTEFHDSDFTLSKDGNVAIWWSQRPGGYGSGDLYVSRKSNNQWMKATNLGAQVNTAHLDYTPSLSPNNAVFYFATNKPYPQQDKGAADIYKIQVKDLPELQTAIAENALEKLKNAFGGYKVLSKIKQISYWIKTESVKSGEKKKKVFIDFERKRFFEYEPKTNIKKYVREGQGIEISNNNNRKLSTEEIKQTLNSMTYNFLYYLTANDLTLVGPINISGHGDINWFHMKTGTAESPTIGIDPMTGQIVKVLGSNGYVTLELDYLKSADGLIWPYRFIMNKQGEQVLTGYFSDLVINPQADDQAPGWFVD